MFAGSVRILLAGVKGFLNLELGQSRWYITGLKFGPRRRGTLACYHFTGLKAFFTLFPRNTGLPGQSLLDLVVTPADWGRWIIAFPLFATLLKQAELPGCKSAALGSDNAGRWAIQVGEPEGLLRSWHGDIPGERRQQAGSSSRFRHRLQIQCASAYRWRSSLQDGTGPAPARPDRPTLNHPTYSAVLRFAGEVAALGQGGGGLGHRQAAEHPVLGESGWTRTRGDTRDAALKQLGSGIKLFETGAAGRSF